VHLLCRRHIPGRRPTIGLSPSKTWRTFSALVKAGAAAASVISTCWSTDLLSAWRRRSADRRPPRPDFRCAKTHAQDLGRSLVFDPGPARRSPDPGTTHSAIGASRQGRARAAGVGDRELRPPVRRVWPSAAGAERRPGPVVSRPSCCPLLIGCGTPTRQSTH